MSSAAPALALDRQHLLDWYRRNRARSRQLFDLLDPDAYYTRPIALRNPIVFYEGHLPAFSVIALLKRGSATRASTRRSSASSSAASIRTASIRPCRGAAPARSGRRATRCWRSAGAPTRPIVEALAPRRVRSRGRRAPRHASRRGDLHRARARGDAPGDAALHVASPAARAEARAASGAALRARRRAAAARDRRDSRRRGDARRRSRRDSRSAGTTSSTRIASTSGAFEIDVHNVTNAEFLEFIDAGGYRDARVWSEAGWQWREQDAHHASGVLGSRRRPSGCWRGMFENVPLPAAWPVYVSYEEAAAFARWRGRRLPTEAEYHRAAFGTPSSGRRASAASRGATRAPGCQRAATSTSRRGSLSRSGARPRGASAWGVHDLVGNGWEWTSTVFGPFPGFEPMASYPEVLRRFLRRPALRHERRLARNRARAGPPQLPQLVQAELSVCVRQVQDGCQLTVSISCQL